MPRSYSFDHFTAVAPGASKQPRPGNLKLSGPRDGGPIIHYGTKHSQTAELYHAHQMEHQLEELAREDGYLPAEEPAAMSSPAPTVAERGEPIGSTPAGAAPPAMLTARDLYEEGARRTKAALTAARQLEAASLRLARFPLDVARWAGQRLKG